MATDYRPGRVAELLGVSVDTVRRWCDDGTLATRRTTGGHRVIPGAELARFVGSRPQAAGPRWLPVESARNRFPGIVLRVQRDGLSAIVEIQAGPHRVLSLMTREGADELGLEPGDLAVATVKATVVTVVAAPTTPDLGATDVGTPDGSTPHTGTPDGSTPDAAPDGAEDPR